VSDSFVSEPKDEQLAMLAALVNGDVSLAYRLATELLAEGTPFDDIVSHVLAPVQTEVGSRWASGELGVAYEHAASAAIEELVIRLGATWEPPTGPTIVVASPGDDTHGLGARVVASSLALEGFRVLFLGAALPAEDLADYIDLHAPFAVALSCSLTAALVTAVGSVSAAHDAGVPVIGGGRAFRYDGLAERVGLDAVAGTAREAAVQLRAWEASPPRELRATPDPIPEHALLADRAPALVAAAVAAADTHGRRNEIAAELARMLHVIEGALLLDARQLVAGQVRWLRETGPRHGVARDELDAALNALADELHEELERVERTLRAALRS
jgi:methanogenic corrinoid protein MtbC1